MWDGKCLTKEKPFESREMYRERKKKLGQNCWALGAHQAESTNLGEGLRREV